jgi:hypothetical protein
MADGEEEGENLLINLRLSRNVQTIFRVAFCRIRELEVGRHCRSGRVLSLAVQYF